MFTPGIWADTSVTDSSASGAAHAANLGTILKRLQVHYQKTKTFRAKFNEEIAAASGARRTRDGTVCYRKPGKMRWEFAGPDSETVVSDGEELYTYTPDLNQVMKAPLRRMVRSSALVAFLLGTGDIKRDFKAELPASPPTDGLVHVVLSPKGGGNVIELGLDSGSYDLASLKITDQLGNVTSLRFSKVQTNVALDDSLFVFEPPKGADIVEAPGAP